MPESSLKDRSVLAAGLAFIWLATGLGVLHPFYHHEGERYLNLLGLGAWWMYLACAIEVLLGLRVLLGPASTWLTTLQISAMTGFTLVLAILEPALLANPFGMLSKNVTLRHRFCFVAWGERATAPAGGEVFAGRAGLCVDVGRYCCLCSVPGAVLLLAA